MNENAPGTAALCVTGPIPATFAVSSFPAPALTSITPTLRIITLDKLVKLLTTHERRRNKNGRGWSGAKYKKGTTRANANVIEWSVAAGDFDHFTMDEYMELRATLVGRGLAVILYSTYNSKPDDFRFRLAIPLTKPIPKAQYTDIWHRMNASLFLGKNDPHTKDASRMLFTPAAPADVAVVAEYIPGLALDWEKLPEAPAWSRRSTVGPVTSGQTSRVSREVLLFTIEGAPDGQQRGMALRAARSFLSAGKSVDETSDLVWRGLQASPVGDDSNPWTEDQAREIVEDLAAREPTPLEEWPELRVGGHAGAGTNDRADGPTVDDGAGSGYFSPRAAKRHRDRVTTLHDVTTTFKKWLHLKDTGPVLVVLATIAANRMQGDPLWLMIVGASSGGKTEILNAASHLDHVHLAAVLTEAALLSGTPKRDKAKDSKGGLLREIGSFGILLLKDFTSILSMNRDPRAALLAALREVYDGSWTRHIGTDGGRTLHWEGKLGLVACCTTIIDAHHAVTSTMGERFLYYRLPEIPPKEQARQALRNAGREREMREELAVVVGGLFANVELPDQQPELSENEAERLVALASLAARARSGVERDGRTREIELIPDAEAPARLVQALRRLYGGLLVIGVARDEAWRLAVKVGLDSMPKLRRSIFEHLVAHHVWSTTTDIAAAVKYPTQTARRSLEDLMVHGLVLRKPGGKGKPDNWMLSPRARRWHAEALGTFPEMSVDEGTDEDNTLLESVERIVSDFSGTPSGGEENGRRCWSCGADLLEELDERCGDCGWLSCRCGACRCNRERQAS